MRLAGCSLVDQGGKEEGTEVPGTYSATLSRHGTVFIQILKTLLGAGVVATPASHVSAGSRPSCLTSVQLHATVPGKAVGPCHPMGNPNGVPGTWLQPDPAQAIAATGD